MPGVLDGRVAIVTGAARGNGLGITRALAGAGGHVVMADIAADALSAAVSEIVDGGGRAEGVVCDVTSEESVTELVARASALGGPHVLVAQAGLPYSSLVTETPLADWNRVFAVDVVGTFLTVRAVIPRMVELGGGSIVTMSGTYAWSGEPGHTLHCAVKGAVMSMTRAIAVEWGHRNIRANTLNPGWINTSMVTESFEARPGEEARGVVARHALGRIGETAEVGRLALFLASDESSFCTGATFTIDGGQTAGDNTFQMGLADSI